MLVKVSDRHNRNGKMDFYYIISEDASDAEYIYSRHLHDIAQFEMPGFQAIETRIPVETSRGYYEKNKMYYYRNVIFTSIRQLLIDEILVDLNS